MNMHTPFLLYKTSNNEIKIDVLLKDETLWLNQKQIAELFAVDRSVITKHLKNIRDEGELDSSACAKIAQVQKEGPREVKRNIEYYNLDMIIAVGYIKLLGLLVEQYLAFAETMVQQKKIMYMKDWIAKLDDIISLNGKELLNHYGKITRKLADEKAELEYKKHKEHQRDIEKIESLKELENDIKKLR